MNLWEAYVQQIMQYGDDIWQSFVDVELKCRWDGLPLASSHHCICLQVEQRDAVVMMMMMVVVVTGITHLTRLVHVGDGIRHVVSVTTTGSQQLFYHHHIFLITNIE